MEKMPYCDEMTMPAAQPAAAADVVTTDWTRGLPALAGSQVMLRELRASDAPSLFSLMTTEEVARFISPPPNTVEGFERFIAWTARQRSAGAYICFAVTLKGYDTAIGIFQIRNLSIVRPCLQSVMSWSSCSGTQLRAAAARSQAALPGPARSKSIRPTA